MTIKTGTGKLQMVEIFSKVIKVLLFLGLAVIAAIYYFNGYDNKFFFVDDTILLKKVIILIYFLFNTILATLVGTALTRRVIFPNRK